MSTPRALFNPVRLLVGVAVVGAILAAYLLLVRQPADANIERAVVLDTATSDGEAVGLELGDRAPDFEFSTPDGERLRLSAFEGRPVVINFWATWCTSCLTEMPDLKALQEKMGGDAFGVLAVNAGETRANAERFIDFLESPFVYAMDPGLVLSDAYGVYGLPLTVFLDAGGVVRGVYRGHASPEVLDTYVTAAIEAQPPGEIPVVLRTVSTIYRPRALAVSTSGPGNLSFASKSLRCDVSYCPEATIRSALEGQPGVSTLEFGETPEGEPRLTVSFDATILRDHEVVSLVYDAVVAQEDPLYVRPLEIEYRGD